MCGIVGIISKKHKSIGHEEMSIFQEMLVCDSIRGADSTGVFSVNDDYNVEFTKVGAHPYALFNTGDWQTWRTAAWKNAHIIVGHNRKATQGRVSSENAHPFIHGPVVLVHNGHISNYCTLVPMKLRDKYKIEVDSHGATYLIANNNPEDVIPKMHGAFTFVWYNAETKELNLIRNDDRPLWFGETQDYYVFASEGGMIRWMLTRRNIKLVDKNVILSVKSNSLLTLDATLPTNKPHWREKSVVTHRASSSYKGWTKYNGSLIVPETYSRHNDVQEYGVKNAKVPELSPPPSQVTGDTAKLIPEAFRFNIHYGHDRDIKKQERDQYQQIIWSIDDFKEIPSTGKPNNSDRKAFSIWGAALESKGILVVSTVFCTEKEIEELAYATHVKSFVRNVVEINPDTVEVVGTQTATVKLVQMHNDTYLTVDHWEYLKTRSNCACNVSFDANEDSTPAILYDPKTNEITIQCSWCFDAEDEAIAKENKDASTPNPTL